jgi:antitoxin MazE
MKVRVQKWGNSLAVRIPKSFAVEARVEQDTEVDLSIVEGRLVISPTRRHTPTLEELLKRVTPQNRHGEFETGPAVGTELW